VVDVEEEALMTKCRVYDAECVNERFCRQRDACCAGDMACQPLDAGALSKALDEACTIALEWIELGIPDDDAWSALHRIMTLRATGTGATCVCTEASNAGCAIHRDLECVEEASESVVVDMEAP
jgi:hypothetical protein